MKRRDPCKGPIRVEDLREQLKGDPQYQARRAERLKTMFELRRESRRIEAPLVADLSEAGFPVESVWDLVSFDLDHRTTLPILLSWLPRMEDPDAKQGIVRALTFKWARPAAARPLIEEFKNLQLTTDEYGGLGDAVGSLKWAIGNALDVVADASVFDDLAEIARDKSHGRTREMVVLALGNLKDARAIDVLLDLLDDPDVAGHAVIALGNLKASPAQHHLEPFLHHDKPWVRQQAKRAIAKIEKAEQMARERKEKKTKGT